MSFLFFSKTLGLAVTLKCFRTFLVLGYFWTVRWLNTVLQVVSSNSCDGACFKLDKQTLWQKKQWYTEDDFSKSTH